MSASRVTIIDGGGANIASLQFALERLGVKAGLSRDPERIRDSSHVILPGVGAAADAMSRLRAAQLDVVIPALKQPVLGICLGMQLLAASSEENSAACLGIIGGDSLKLQPGAETPVPNMGWCPLNINGAHPILEGISDGSYFYFVHSYALPPADYTIASAVHRTPFTAVLARDNFIATQFHPERSALAGARLLQNFLDLSE
jgi:glutamine amidotransferase